MLTSRTKHALALLVGCVILIGADLWLKVWASANVAGTARRVIIPGFLGITYTRNYGMAFGLLQGANVGVILSIVTGLILCGVTWYYFRLPAERRFWLFRVPLIFIIAGGAGNLIDRIWMGSVRDMLEFLFVNFFVFNLADVFITGGVFAMIFVNLFFVKDMPFP